MYQPASLHRHLRGPRTLRGMTHTRATWPLVDTVQDRSQSTGAGRVWRCSGVLEIWVLHTLCKRLCSPAQQFGRCRLSPVGEPHPEQPLPLQSSANPASGLSTLFTSRRRCPRSTCQSTHAAVKVAVSLPVCSRLLTPLLRYGSYYYDLPVHMWTLHQSLCGCLSWHRQAEDHSPLL